LKDFDFFWRIFWRLYFCMVKYLRFHNSFFALRCILMEMARPQCDSSLVFFVILSELRFLKLFEDRVLAHYSCILLILVGARDLRPLWSFISFIFSYLLLFIWPLPCPICPAIENVARRHRCPIISEETTNDGGFFVFTTYLLLPFGKVTR